MRTEKIPIKEINADDRLQHRTLDVNYINDLIVAVEDGAVLPPVSVIYDGEKNWLFDGFHRYNVARILKKSTIEANVYDGDYRAAWELSLGVNDKCGLRRNGRDIHKILGQCMADPEISKLSSAKIARLVSCGEDAVRRFRKAADKKHATEAALALESKFTGLSTDSGAATLSEAAAGAAKLRGVGGGGTGSAAHIEHERRRARIALYELCMAIDTMGHFDELKESLAHIKAVGKLF